MLNEENPNGLGDIRTSVTRLPDFAGFGIWFRGRQYLGQPLIFKKYDDIDKGRPFLPALTLKESEIQMLMDQLYAAGVRPTKEGSAGQFAATNKHLEDMRSLAFEAIKSERDSAKVNTKNLTDLLKMTPDTVVNVGKISTLKAGFVGMLDQSEEKEKIDLSKPAPKIQVNSDCDIDKVETE